MKSHALHINLGWLYIIYHSPKYSHPEHPISNTLCCIMLFGKHFYI